MSDPAKYSIDEIDAMRGAMHRYWFNLPFDGMRHYSEDAERTKHVAMEEALRTYLKAGVPSIEVIGKYKKLYDDYVEEYYKP